MADGASFRRKRKSAVRADRQFRKRLRARQAGDMAEDSKTGESYGEVRSLMEVRKVSYLKNPISLEMGVGQNAQITSMKKI